jgi:dipeptidyl aminopeptidase/acylaminoacyl peptidase
MEVSPNAFLEVAVSLRFLLIVAGLCLLAGYSAADEDEFTLEAFLAVPTINSPAVSPDGSLVAWRVTNRDLEADRYVTRLWLGEPATGHTRQLTFLDEGTGGLAWRPDGALSYLRAHDGQTQVWVNPLDGSEPRPVTELPEGLSAYWWSPDGTLLAVLAPGQEPEAAEVSEEGETEDPDRADWTVFDRLEHPEQYHQVWLVEVGRDGPAPGAEPRQLTSQPWHPSHVAWSPDGTTLAVTYNARFSSLVDEDQQIALIDTATGEAETITPADRHSSLAAWSPDGEQLAYFTDRDQDYRAYLNLKDLVLRDTASGETRVLTGESRLTLAGYGATPGHAPVWDEAGRTLYLTAASETDLDIYALDTESGILAPVTDLEGSATDFSLGGGTLAYLETALDRPGSLLVGPVDGEPAELATTNDAVAAFGLEPARKLRLPGHDGGFVDAFLFLPPGKGADDRLPAIIEMHGGPYSRYGNAWTTRYPWQVLARNGFAVMIVNPRGGTGYGADFLRGVYRNFGTDDYLDIMAAVDEMVARRTFDAGRMGFTGYSYGGLMTDVVVSRTDRFKAAVSIAGIWNYTSAMGQNNPQLFVDSYDRAWDQDLQRLWEHSPASRAGQVTTPTLIMHGTDDEPVDPRQSIEMFSYLQLNGVPSRLVLYPGEGHGINKPSHMIDYQTRELQWFRHYLLGDEQAAGAEPAVPVEP